MAPPGRCDAGRTPTISPEPGPTKRRGMQYTKAFSDALQVVWGKGFLSPRG